MYLFVTKTIIFFSSDGSLSDSAAGTMSTEAKERRRSPPSKQNEGGAGGLNQKSSSTSKLSDTGRKLALSLPIPCNNRALMRFYLLPSSSHNAKRTITTTSFFNPRVISTIFVCFIMTKYQYGGFKKIVPKNADAFQTNARANLLTNSP